MSKDALFRSAVRLCDTDNLLKTRAWVTGELAKTRREFEFQVRFSEN